MMGPAEKMLVQIIAWYQTDNKPLSEPMAYRQTSNIRGTLVGNKHVDHSDVVGASPVDAAPTTSASSFST